MGLRFILGRAGTGKTYYILNSLCAKITEAPAGLPLILLVPEQATFQMEYTLTVEMGLGGAIRAQVLSFRRLAHRVLLETGGAARVPVGELGKRMILRELLERHKPDLRVFGRSAGRPGFADCLARAIGELKTYLVAPETLAQASASAAGTDALFKAKLSDLALLYRELENYLAPRYTDPDDYLKLLAERIVDSSTFRGAEFWIDGFKGFTPQELAVLGKLLQTAGEVNLSLCLDPACLAGKLSAEHLFYPPWETYRELTRLAEANGVPVYRPVKLQPANPPRFAGCPEIAHLEKNYFRYPTLKFESNGRNIRLASAANRQAEVEACAREIIRLARDRGYRWREMAVILRDLDSYHGLIREVFQGYEIPFFIDRKYPVRGHPLVELVLAAVEAVLKDWAYDPVFRYLKTDLVPVTREQVDFLENYVLAHGIRGTKWMDEHDWTFRRRYTIGEDMEVTDREQAKLAAVNEIRREAGQALANFSRKIQEAAAVRAKTAALYELLVELRVREKIEDWRIEAEKAGDLKKAREHVQIWAGVVNLFDQVVAALGEVEVSLEIFLDILAAGFQGMTVGLIPPGLDQVVVGSLDRSRSPEVRALFVLGVGAGVLPAGVSDDGIFSDHEREKLAAFGIKLAPGSRQRVFEEQFLVYLALTRASSRLWVSYPLADEEGRALAPSPVIGRIKELMPLLAEDSFQVEPGGSDENTALTYLVHPDRALTYLTGRLREAKAGELLNPIWWDLYNWFAGGGWREKARPVLRSIFHVNQERALSGQTSGFLYGRPLKVSVSKIERFLACPFAFFSLYGLGLKERPVFRLEAPEMGEFFHAVLKNLGEKLLRNSQDWGSLSRETCSRLSEEAVEELAPQLQSEILLSTARYRYLTGKLKRIVNRAVLVLGEHGRRSKFRPVGLELSFSPGDRLPPLTITLAGGEQLQLTGRIDRLEAAQAGDEIYLRVIDYKSSDHDLRPADIYYGLGLQLLTYLHVALNSYTTFSGRKAKPAGILYFTVREPLISTKGPLSEEDLERAVLGRLKMKGILLADRRVFELMDNRVETGYSDLFPVAVKKDASFYPASSVLDEEQFSLLRVYLEKLFGQAGEEILAGNVSIKPARSKLRSACRYCSGKPVCQFDPLFEGNKYRVLPELSESEVWSLITGKEEGNG